MKRINKKIPPSQLKMLLDDPSKKKIESDVQKYYHKAIERLVGSPYEFVFGPSSKTDGILEINGKRAAPTNGTIHINQGAKGRNMIIT